MNGNKARALRQLAAAQFKASGGKHGIFWDSRAKNYMINAYKNYYRRFKALYKQGRLQIHES